MLTRIRNANKALHDRVEMPSSKLKDEIARILKEEGYIRDFHVVETRASPYKTLVSSSSTAAAASACSPASSASRSPAAAIYARKDRLPRVLGGMGTAILSTSSGVITSRTAEREGIGGEVICFVW